MNNCPANYSRGTVFVSADGSSMTFISDQPIYDSDYSFDVTENVSGYLLSKDGTRYRIDDGRVTWIRDHNGNLINYTYTPAFLTSITDSLNRQVTIEYGVEGGEICGVYGRCERLKFMGADGQPRYIWISYAFLSQTLRSDFPSIRTIYGLFPELCPSYGDCSTYDANYDAVVISAVWLPDGRSYRFKYNPYGELSRVEIPTGGAYEYDWEAGPMVGPNGGLASPAVIYRRVRERRVYANGESGNNWTNKTTYQITEAPYGQEFSDVDVSTWAAGVSQPITREKHYFYGKASNSFWTRTDYVGSASYPEWREGREYRTELQDGAGTVLRRVEQIWEQGCPVGSWAPQIPQNPRIREIQTKMEDSNQISRQLFGYDCYNNRTDVYEYDYGTGAPGQLKRRSHTDYITDTNYTAYTGAHLRGLPLQAWVSSDINGNTKASLTQFEYDNYNTDTNHATLVSRVNVALHDTANYGANVTRRGNVTAVTSYGNAQNQTEAISAYSNFDILGNVVKVIDAKGYVSTIDYTDRFGSPDGEARSNTAPTQLNGQSTFAFPTSATNPIGYMAYTQFDYFTGQAVNTEDVNGVISKVIYNDVLDRPTQSFTAVGTAFERQSNIVYDDANRRIETKSDLNSLNDNLIKAESFYDGLGRTTEARSYRDGGYVASKTEYDALGRVKRVSNPYRPLQNEQAVWTESKYDALSRVIEIKTPDNAQVLTNYAGNTVTVTDQAGKQRRSITNALGQLTRVDEPNTAGQLDVGGVAAQPTNYAYDTLSNLTTASQSGQTRSFVYDSLSRLKSATNPELGTTPTNGTISYQYDNNGNLTQKTDARNVVTNYVYDNLNRVTARNYTAPANLPNYQATLDVTYTYDDTNVANSKGKLTKVTTGSVSNPFSITEYTEFDILGRVKKSKQTTDGTAYNEMLYSYNLSGALIEETYPSGRVVKNVLDNDGDLAIVQSKKNQNSGFFNYAKNFTYTAAGAVSSMQLGNGKWESTQFNSRLQPTQIALGTVQNGTDKLKLNYSYNTPNIADNNGNVLSQTITVPTVGSNTGFTATQTYTYDSLNRLKDAKEMIGTTQTWKQTFTFDRYGNRNFDAANTTTLGSCPTNQCNPTVNVANNRFTSGQGYTYDLAGNIISDAQGRTFTYDAENKQKEVKDGNNISVGQYFYDGDGKRVKKFIFNTQETTLFVYDASGKMVAEYSTTVAPVSEAKVSYLTTDHLGSPRITTDANGQVISRRDFLPFGEEVFTAQRTQGLGYTADNVRQKFTSKERDIETDLDYFFARHYSSEWGRFLSADPLLKSAHPFNPQMWNRYAYVLNRPTVAIDKNGLSTIVVTVRHRRTKQTIRLCKINLSTRQ